LAVPILAVLLTAVVFYGAHRIRAPAEPAVIALAALGAVAVVERVRRGSSEPAVAHHASAAA
jgi:hypothetical protein